MGLRHAPGWPLGFPVLDQFKLWIERPAGGVELTAAVIIGLAAIEAVWRASSLRAPHDVAGGEGRGEAQPGKMACA
jgi:hypothetical protein